MKGPNMNETNEIERRISEELRAQADGFALVDPHGWDRIASRLPTNRHRSGWAKTSLIAAAVVLVVAGAALAFPSSKPTEIYGVAAEKPSCADAGPVSVGITQPGMGFGATNVDLSDDGQWLCLREGDKWWGIRTDGTGPAQGLVTVQWSPATNHRFTMAILPPAVAKVVVTVDGVSTVYADSSGFSLITIGGLRAIVATELTQGPVTVEAFTSKEVSLGKYVAPELTVDAGGKAMVASVGSTDATTSGK